MRNQSSPNPNSSPQSRSNPILISRRYLLDSWRINRHRIQPSKPSSKTHISEGQQKPSNFSAPKKQTDFYRFEPLEKQSDEPIVGPIEGGAKSIRSIYMEHETRAV